MAQQQSSNENQPKVELQEEKPLKSLGKEEHGNIWARWSFPEFVRHQRGTGWLIFMIILTVALLIWSFTTRNFLFAAIILIFDFIIFQQHRQEPISVDFQITENGLRVGSNFYEWKRIKKFWIIYKPPEIKRIYFQLTSILPPFLSIPLEKEHPVEIRRILLKYAIEDLEKEDESLTDFLGRSLKIH